MAGAACYKTQGNVKGHFGLVDGSKWGFYKRKLYQQRYGIQVVDAKLDAAGYPDIEAFLHLLGAAYKQAQAAPVAELFKRPQEWPQAAEYVDPEILARKDTSIHGLDPYLVEWLKVNDGSRQFLVLLGEFGTGKTQFSYRAEQLVRDHSRRAPVLVKLGQFHKGADPASIAAVAAPGAEQRFLDANRDGALVMILDAFDEMGKATAAQSLNDSFRKLTSGLIHGRAKIILTCRKELFRAEGDVDGLAYERTMGDRGSGDKVIAEDAEKVEVQLFDETRIQRALALRNRSEIFEQIRGNERVLDLARRPVLLDLIAQYNRPFDANTKLADLYEKYIDKMLERGPDDRHAYERREFAEKIAWIMQNSGPMPAIELEKPLKEMGFEAEADRFRSRSLLVRQVNDYVFGHASFREYLVAKQIVPFLKENKFVECKLSDPAIAFIREMWTWTPTQPVEKEGMMWIPPGPFIYGDPTTARMANLEMGFWIDKYPVTNRQYLDFLQSTGKRGLFKRKIDKKWIDHSASRITREFTLQDPKWADHPVVGVSWFGAEAYAEAAGKRLCTEEEWERAARGMDGRQYPWGDGFDPSNANTDKSQIRGTTPVTAYADGVSGYGVFDMAGNTWEWTASAESNLKVLRGGCWSNDPEGARCAYRVGSNPEGSYDYGFGFRCART